MKKIGVSEITLILQEKIEQFKSEAKFNSEGIIVTLSDGIVTAYGLSEAVYGEMIKFENDGMGIALNLEQDSVGIVVLSGFEGLSQGQKVFCTSRILEVPVGEELLGRVIDPLGKPIDNKGTIQNIKEYLPIERIAPGVIAREPVSTPLQTGLKAIDSMVPIGRGQRELIIGDRQTGKTAIAADTIINQKGQNVFCVYVAIGQKLSSVAALVKKLEDHDAMKHTIVVAASASDPAAMQYISAYSGCAMAEYFRDKGMDSLIIYDDLSKHAVAYRQLSLLLRRPPGREAFPGDIFYLHSRLLERAARINAEYVEKITKGKVKGKTGSLTALPIIETQAGDLSAFVPTNVISITDGQIFLESDLFNANIRPAMDPGASVSRVGGAAQTKIIKKLGGGVRLALAQYRDLAAFSQFASDLDASTKAQLDKGQRVTELMKQKQYDPLSVGEMSLILYFANSEELNQIAISDMTRFEEELRSFTKVQYPDVLEQVNNKPELTDEIKSSFEKIVSQFTKAFVPSNTNN